MGHSARAVANEFLDLAEADRDALTPMKIQKLVYFAHGWHLAIEDAPLIEETVEAWHYGPVVRSLYKAVKHYGRRPIAAKAIEYDDEMEETYEAAIGDHDGLARAVVRRVWEVYGSLTAIQLSNMTHEPDTPWHQVWTGTDGQQESVPIPDELIRKGQADGEIAKRGKPKKLQPAILTLAEVGVDGDTSSRSQKLADIPAPTVEAYVEKAKAEADDGISKAGLTRGGAGVCPGVRTGDASTAQPGGFVGLASGDRA